MVSIGDIYATIYKAFGIDWTKTYMTPIGRPIYIANCAWRYPGRTDSRIDVVGPCKNYELVVSVSRPEEARNRPFV